MVKDGRSPELIVIAGPNGSGKTSVTQRYGWVKNYSLNEKLSEGCLLI